jgi:hypothetical protein
MSGNDNPIWPHCARADSTGRAAWVHSAGPRPLGRRAVGADRSGAAAVVEFERELIRERTIAGLAAARAGGGLGGGKAR